MVEGDFEGQFTASNQMPAFLECVIPSVEEWIDSTYQAMPEVVEYYFVPAGVTGTDISGCPYSEEVLGYCNGQGTIYLGEAVVWQLYSQFGDAAPAVVVAHEVTHHFQAMVGMIIGYTDSRQIPFENQADCGAGAFMAYARNRGLMNIQDDIVDLAGALQAAGEAEGQDRDHGTAAERLSAFDLGYLSQQSHPLYDCVGFIPDIPILAS